MRNETYLVKNNNTIISKIIYTININWYYERNKFYIN